MRAETQNHIDQIEKSLKLLAQRLDWETAPHRLEEFDALIEDPNLWNDPAKAQKLMKERQALMDAIAAYKLIDGGLRDNVELIELGEAEGDAEVVTEAEAALKALVADAAQRELEALRLDESALAENLGEALIIESVAVLHGGGSSDRRIGLSLPPALANGKFFRRRPPHGSHTSRFVTSSA